MSLLIEQTYQKSTQILDRLTSTDGGNIKTIYEPGYISAFDLVASTRFYGYITDLRCKINIKSLEEQELPEISIGDSRTARVNAVRDMEWRSPRKQLDILLRSAKSGDWFDVASISLLNRDPFYQVNLLQYLSDNVAFAVANDSAIGVRIVNVGYGLLTQQDEVTFWGSVKEELNIVPSAERVITHTNSHSWSLTDQSQIILPNNQERLQATLVNTGTSTAYLNFNTAAIAGLGIALVPQGGSYEINLTNPFKGTISAICNQGQTTTVSGIEGE